MIENAKVTRSQPNVLPIAGISILFAILGTLGILFWAGWLVVPPSSRQVMVHDMGSHVMPFDLTQTTHIFEMTESGGVQQVIAKNTDDTEQVALIQQHLQHEAMMFSTGDFSDPTSLHGDAMPGIKELTAGAAHINVEYAALPDGGQITFTTQDLQLITAIHRWFGAQLSDHGSDATSR